MEINEKIRSFILENSHGGLSGETLDDNDSFLDKGIIDSTGILELVAFIEENFGITVNDDELIPDNFDSINKTGIYISKKKNG